MFEGKLVGIYVAAEKAAPLRRARRATAVAGAGLEGDRYFVRAGTFSKKHGPDREVTLIEEEALDAAARDFRVRLAPGQSRRNLVTRGVPLNHLVGREFSVGDVVLRGIKLCDPCGHLERLTVPGIQKALANRGGLRASVVRGGALRPGAAVRPREKT